MPTLVLLRHAKSDWPAHTADVDRPLAQRGINDCKAIAQEFASHGLTIDEAVVSVAQRARETFSRTFEAAGYEPQHHFDERIYEAHVQNLLDVVRELSADTVLLVGHGPGIPQLALLLATDVECEPALRIRRKFPTAGVAVLTSELPWSQWGAGQASLDEFLIPRANPSDPDND